MDPLHSSVPEPLRVGESHACATEQAGSECVGVPGCPQWGRGGLADEPGVDDGTVVDFRVPLEQGGHWTIPGCSHRAAVLSLCGKCKGHYAGSYPFHCQGLEALICDRWLGLVVHSLFQLQR